MYLLDFVSPRNSFHPESDEHLESRGCLFPNISNHSRIGAAGGLANADFLWVLGAEHRHER